MNPLVSVIIPCYNEEKHIDTLCQDLIHQDYPRENLEIFFIDGHSKDNTRILINHWVEQNNHFYLLDNPKRYVPFALNLAIAESHGSVIVRMDAHARYPSTYISKLVESLLSLDADNVGGAWDTVPSGPGLLPLAIARAMSSVFGIGNAMYRLSSGKIMQVDTVPFGCYRRDVFERCGGFDEELIRNQDDEFNARLIQKGGKIFLVPEVRITYFARESIPKVMKMFYQYGLFKPLVNLKIGRPATLRQFVPPVYVLLMILSFVTAIFIPASFIVMMALLVFHLGVGVIFSIQSGIKTKRFALIVIMPLIFLSIHLSYGYGYLRGIIRFIVFRKKFAAIETTR